MGKHSPKACSCQTFKYNSIYCW
ncbi:MAG: SWIM zinc finger family protein [Candidatus Cloacimonetes bacterium]|nr:SWIM zinc finger family protein [Candidatus Cloacimonadota bacterium]